MTRHIFGTISSSAIANKTLKRTGEDHGYKYCEAAKKAIDKKFYVDDCLMTEDHRSSASKLASDLMELCAEGGFRLTKWLSNDKEVLAAIPAEERAPEVKSLDLDNDNLPVTRALGIQWSPETDTLSFDVHSYEKSCTRRGILSVVSYLFDPLGLVAPLLLPAKVLLQDICRKGIGWDDPIDETFLKRWKLWLDGLQRLSEWKIPRCYKSKLSSDIVNRQLHVFADACNKGYGMCAYLRQEDNEGKIQVALVLAKSRVAPLKYISIPRLELTSAVMAARLADTIISELDVKEVYYWSDSQTALKYISNDTHRFKSFVANRVSVIRDLTDPSQWNYVRTNNNPADEASRGLTIDEFLKDKRWIDGPELLYQCREQWPSLQQPLTPIADDPEIKIISNATVDRHHECFLDDLITRFSSYSKLKRVVATVMMFVDRAKKKAKGIPIGTGLTLDILEASERLILTHEQERHFSTEIKALKGDDANQISTVMRNSPLRKLDPIFIDDTILVVGRLRRATLPKEAKNQIIIPKNSVVAKLIVMDTHKQVGHMGRAAMLAKLLQKYWVMGAGSIIKGIISHCVTCRKYQARPASQKMAALPIEGVTSDKPPFHDTGIDMFGPFEIKQGRSMVKRYGLIFTCLATRAIHLELLHTANTDSCLSAIRRFVSQRGSISSIRTDNGTNFVATEKELKEAVKAWNKSQIPQWLMQNGIRWEFNPPAASHFGGVWERLIRVIRQVMNGVLKEQHIRFNDEGLSTLFYEVENIINGRPITTVSSDADDLRPLTPNMLLTLNEKTTLPPGVFIQSDVYARRCWRQIQYLADLYWKRWRKEYLPLMQRRQKWLYPKRNLEIGDLVLVLDESLPRNSWLMGKIIGVKADDKGYVRTCTVKTQFSTLVRPVTKLCVLLEEVKSS